MSSRIVMHTSNSTLREEMMFCHFRVSRSHLLSSEFQSIAPTSPLREVIVTFLWRLTGIVMLPNEFPIFVGIAYQGVVVILARISIFVFRAVGSSDLQTSDLLDSDSQDVE